MREGSDSEVGKSLFLADLLLHLYLHGSHRAALQIEKIMITYLGK